MRAIMTGRKALGIAVAAIGVSGLSSLSTAAVLEEVVVTAQKREQNLQEVGVSVSAFTGDQAKALGWTSSEDVAAQTPGLIATSFSGDSSVSIFTLRGVGQNDFADHQEAPSAMYVDGAYVASTGAAGFQMFDLERVEVLRGPQGTLFGRNATGGLVHIINKKPTEEFEAYVDATLGDYNQRRLETAISGPLSDKVLGRLSLLKDDADGYFNNVSGEDARNRDLLSWRGQLEFRPTDSTTINLKAWGNVVDKNIAGAYDYRPSDTQGNYVDMDFQGVGDITPKANERSLSPVGMIDKDAKGYSATVVMDFENFTLTSITDYQDLQKFYLEDSDSNPSSTMQYWSDQDSQQFSQELRLNGDLESLRWTAGLYYLDIEGSYASNIDMLTFGGATTNDFTLETKSWSVFGQVEKDLSESLALTVGLRYVSDEKDFEIDSFCSPSVAAPAGSIDPALGAPNDCSWISSFDPANPVIAEVDQVHELDRKDTDYSGKIQLDWKVNDDLLVYAGISRGMKGGGFTAPLDGLLPVNELDFDPEILINYEAGFKATLLDGRARLNASVFRYDYSDYQAFIFQGLTSVVRNYDAEITGAEVEFYISPADGWDISLGLSALDARVHDVEVAAGVYKDQDMITAPDLTANLLVRKAWSLNSGELAVQLDGQYVSEQQFNTTNSVVAQSDSFQVWNAKASYMRDHGDNSWEVSVFAKNFGDEEYRTYAFDMSEFFGYTLEVYGPPRWVGAQFQYHWN
jgi:iron complex outermembrane recepter protein